MNQRGRVRKRKAPELSTITNVTCRSGGYIGGYAILANAGIASAERW
jgi:hypothetical protein